jgi:hypothetical protein
VRPFAPGTSEQFAPASSHRCHWNANERTPPVHVPVFAVSSLPTTGEPVIVGRAVFRGGWFEEMTSVGAELAVAEPSAFEAVTNERMVLSTSAATSV